MEKFLRIMFTMRRCTIKREERELKISLQNELEKNQYYLIDWEDRRGIVSKIAKVNQAKIDKDILDKLNANS